MALTVSSETNFTDEERRQRYVCRRSVLHTATGVGEGADPLRRLT